MADWECVECTTINSATGSNCEVCLAKNPMIEINQTISEFYPNDNEFECQICLENISPGEGVILSMCTHEICRGCLAQQAFECNDSKVLCPFVLDDGKTLCNQHVLDCELKAILSKEQYEVYIARMVQATRRQLPNSYNCLTPNCKNFVIFEGHGQFTCDICKRVNCIDCNCQHYPMNCKQYKDEQRRIGLRDEKQEKDKLMVQNMIKEGKAMLCPGCGSLIEKNGGCYFVRCRTCKLECCWGIKGARWGPKGRGDETGGCHCGFYTKGKKCVPDCPGCSYG